MEHLFEHDVGNARGHRKPLDTQVGDIEDLAQGDGFAREYIIGQFVEDQHRALEDMRLNRLQRGPRRPLDVEIENRQTDQGLRMAA